MIPLIKQKIPVLRYGLVVLLFIVLFVSTEYLLLHYQKADVLKVNIDKLISARENAALIDSCIIKLNSADNYTRLYTVTGDKKYLTRSSTEINGVLTISDKISSSVEDQNGNKASAKKLRELIKQKKARSNEYVQLKLLNDRLINKSKTIAKSFNQIQKQIEKPAVRVEHTVSFDTVKVAQPESVVANTSGQSNKKFLGKLISSLNPKNRLKDAGKKNDGAVPAEKEIIIKRDTIVYKQMVNKAAMAQHNSAYKDYSNNLNSVNDKLRDKEEQLLLLNNHLTEQIITGLTNYRSAEVSYAENSKNFLQKNLASIFWEFKKVSAVTFIFVLFLLGLVFYNIWKIFRNEQKIIEYSEKAEEYARAKSNFLAGMSHEIRTPLNSVIGFSEQLAKSDLTCLQKEQVIAIRNSSEMLLDIVNEILDFSKYETGKMNFDNQTFLPGKAIADVFTTMQILAAKKGIILENFNSIHEEFYCDGDKMRLKQVLMNLLGNAIKFTVKGKVSLYAHIEPTDAVCSMLKIRVIDTGLGIDKNDLPHIFEEFSQVEKSQKVTRHKGTGLGLAICKKIIELQGGTIKVSSTPGVGSTFSFELPLNIAGNNKPIVDTLLDRDVMADIVRGRHALVVDDNHFNVLLATTILTKWKITHDVAYNGLEAIALVDSNDYDMVLTDIEMPELDGLQLMKYIRTHKDESKANTPIMALTANVLKEDRDKYIKGGANDVIVKPFLEYDLIEKMAANIQNYINAVRFIA